MFHLLILFSALVALIVFITMVGLVQHFFRSKNSMKKEIERGQESVDTRWCILHNRGDVESYVYLSSRIN